MKYFIWVYDGWVVDQWDVFFAFFIRIRTPLCLLLYVGWKNNFTVQEKGVKKKSLKSWMNKHAGILQLPPLIKLKAGNKTWWWGWSLMWICGDERVEFYLLTIHQVTLEEPWSDSRVTIKLSFNLKFIHTNKCRFIVLFYNGEENFASLIYFTREAIAEFIFRAFLLFSFALWFWWDEMFLFDRNSRWWRSWKVIWLMESQMWLHESLISVSVF